MALAPPTFKQLTKQQVFPNVCCNIGAFSGPVADKSLHVADKSLRGGL